MTEQWRPIAGYEGRYEVSDQGRVRSLDRTLTMRDGRTRRSPGRVLRARLNRGGYPQVTLCADGKPKVTRTVHSLVTAAFLGPIPAGQETLHRNGNSADPRLANLRFGTHSENIRDAVAHGSHPEARKTECPAGHSLTDPANVYVYHYPSGREGRQCRRCKADWQNRWYHSQNRTAS